MEFTPDKHRHILGNGTLLIVTEPPGIEHLGTYSECFCSVRNCITDYKSVIDTTADPGILSYKSLQSSVKTDSGEEQPYIRFIMYIDPEKPIFAITCAAMFDAVYKVIPSCDTKCEYFEQYSSEMRRVPCLKLINKRGGTISVMFDGNARFNEETNELTFKAGKSRVILSNNENDDALEYLRSAFFDIKDADVFGSLPNDRVYKRAVAYYKKYTKNMRSLSSYSLPVRLMTEESRRRIYGLQAKEGGIICSGSISMSRLDIMASLMLFFLVNGQKERAGQLIGFICDLYEKYGRLPLMCTPDGRKTLFADNCHTPVCSAVMLAFFRYYLLIKKKIVDDRHFAVLRYCFDEQARYLCRGMLPFSGTEDCFTDRRLPSDARFQGSSKNTILFIAAGEKYSELLKDRADDAECSRVNEILATVKKYFQKNFLTKEGLAVNNPMREAFFKRPNKITGFCDGCGELSALGNKSGGYYCKRCYPFFQGIKSTFNERIYSDDLVLYDGFLGTRVLPNIGITDYLGDLSKLSISSLAVRMSYFRGKPPLLAMITDELIGRLLPQRTSVLIEELATASSMLLEYPVHINIKPTASDNI